MQKILNYQSISDNKVLHNNIEIEIWNHWKDFEAFKLISKQESVSNCFRLNYPTYELRNYWMDWYESYQMRKIPKNINDINTIQFWENFEKHQFILGNLIKKVKFCERSAETENVNKNDSSKLEFRYFLPPSQILQKSIDNVGASQMFRYSQNSICGWDVTCVTDHWSMCARRPKNRNS